MFIAKSEYEALVKRADSKVTLEEYEILEKKYDKSVSSFEERIEEILVSQKKNLDNLTEQHNIVIANKDAQIENKIYQETKSLREDLAKVTMEKNNAVNKSEILEKAFANLGFDVKDMKGILNKLVDGIVSKNTINLIKSN